MTARGRITIAGLAGLAAVCGHLALSADSGALPAALSALPAVAAPPPSPKPALPYPPTEMLARLPSGRRVLELLESGASGERFVETLPVPEQRADLSGPLRVEYSFDPDLTRSVFRILRRARVDDGHVIVLDPRSGRVLAYASTDASGFPPARAYPAASLIKVVTAAAALDRSPDAARRPCIYRGNPYRLRRSQLQPPASGRRASLEQALATSNNQCFARLAVNAVGADALLAAIDRFGWLEPPAPGHAAGSIDLGDDALALGRLGCGLAGCRITPLHAAQLAGTLLDGRRVPAWWIERIVDAEGRSLPLPRRRAARRVMTPELAAELRGMLVRTTTRGTARSAFRDRRGRLRLGDIRVAGKTGTLSGRDPSGRYEWFIGLAPADAPRLAISVLQLQDDLWWQTSAQIAESVLAAAFCERSRCRAGLADRLAPPRASSTSAAR